MRRDDDGLASPVALGNHHLLCEEDLRGRNLDTKVTTGDHDTVCLPQDLVKVGDTLFVLDFDDDLDVGTVWAEDVTDIANILGATDEGREDHVAAVLDTEAEVGLVLLRESGAVDVGLREVDTLARGKSTVVEGANVDVGAVNGGDEEGKDTVIDVDVLAGGGDLGKVGLGDKNTRSEIRKKR